MKKLSKLSQECIKNKGLCCENRTPPFLLPKEKNKLINKKNSKYFIIKNNFTKSKGLCCFFNIPFCKVYNNRPIDCRTYPVSIDIKKDKIIFIIDHNCPAVKKEIVTKRFINHAMKSWKYANPKKEWIKEYMKNDNHKNYDWIKISNYIKKIKK